MSALLLRQRIGAAIGLCAILLTACLVPPSLLRPLPLRAGAQGQLAVSTKVQGQGRTQVLQPQSPGTKSYSASGATLDVSNVSEGYVTASYSGTASRVKIQITREGGNTYTYDVPTSGSYAAFPLTLGDGKYRINVYTLVNNNLYAEALGKSVDVKLRNALLPFLYPSQYVNFSASSQTVKVSGEITKNAENELAVVTDVYNYVTKNISYDNDKANRVLRGELNGYVAKVDDTLASGKGICLDYAAVMTAMLRSQQIPTRLEVGYVTGGIYHAWISTYIKDVGWVNGAIYFDGKTWRLMDPTFAAGGSEEVLSFIGNGENYQRQFVY